MNETTQQNSDPIAVAPETPAAHIAEAIHVPPLQPDPVAPAPPAGIHLASTLAPKSPPPAAAQHVVAQAAVQLQALQADKSTHVVAAVVGESSTTHHSIVEDFLDELIDLRDRFEWGADAAIHGLIGEADKLATESKARLDAWTAAAEARETGKQADIARRNQ